VAGLQADILEVFNEMESKRKELDPRLTFDNAGPG
jgi:hypothetical protein